MITAVKFFVLPEKATEAKRKKEKDVENLILSYNSQLQAQQQKK